MSVVGILIVLAILGVLFWVLPAKILIGALMALLLIDCVLLVTVVLMQRSKSDGLAGGAAFGGGFTEQFFGAGTPAMLVKVTSWLGGIFFGTALVLAVLFSYQNKAKHGEIEKLLSKEPAKAAASNALDRVTKEASVSTNAASAIEAETNAPAKKAKAPKAR